VIINSKKDKIGYCPNMGLRCHIIRTNEAQFCPIILSNGMLQIKLRPAPGQG